MELILNRRGRVVVSGIGKSGHVGRKLAVDARIDGHAGVLRASGPRPARRPRQITPDDVVVMLSNSGETDELVTLTPHLKRAKARG